MSERFQQAMAIVETMKRAVHANDQAAFDAATDELDEAGLCTALVDDSTGFSFAMARDVAAAVLKAEQPSTGETKSTFSAAEVRQIASNLGIDLRGLRDGSYSVDETTRVLAEATAIAAKQGEAFTERRLNLSDPDGQRRATTLPSRSDDDETWDRVAGWDDNGQRIVS